MMKVKNANAVENWRLNNQNIAAPAPDSSVYAM
jgi:hypothetical protein